MKIKLFLIALIGACSLNASYAQFSSSPGRAATDSLAPLVGQWSGTFDGNSSGKLELTLQRENSSTQQLGGQLTVILSDGTRYATQLKTAAFKNNQFMATYNEPDDGSEVSLQGQLSGPVLKGSWQVKDGQGQGSWQAIHPLR